MPLQAIFDACNAINPYVTGMQGYLLLGVLPFNLIKAQILTAITMLAYKKLSVFIKSKQIELHHSRQRDRLNKKTKVLFIKRRAPFLFNNLKQCGSSMISTKICIRIDKMRGQDISHACI